MALNYTTLFDRIGKGFYVVNLVHEFRGAAGSGAIATDLPTEWEDFVEEYDGENDALRAVLADPTEALRSAYSGLNGFSVWVQTALGRTITEMVDAETPLTSRDAGSALAGLVALMLADSQTVDANAVSAAATAAVGNVGDGGLVLSVLDGSGRTLEYSYAETIAVTFSATTSATFNGQQAAEGGPLQQRWPKGSGLANFNLTTITAGGAGDLLSGAGTFETFTVPNVPDGWTIGVGAAGTDVLEEATAVYAGDASLAIVGDGSTLVALSLPVPLSGLAAKTPYALHGWIKADTTPAAGVLTFDLYDGTAVVDDEAGAANTLAVNLTAVDDSEFERLSAVFRLPEPLPAELWLRVRLTTALTNTRVVYLDHLALGEMSPLYTGGPYCAVFTGVVPFSLDDTFELVVANDYGGTVQTGFWRMFDMPALGLVLPSATGGGETIADSVIS